MQKIVTKQPLTKRYDIDSEISKFEKNTYFIGKTKRKKQTGETLYALYKLDIHQRKAELVEGVDKMKIILNSLYQDLNITLTFSSEKFFKKTWFLHVGLRE